MENCLSVGIVVIAITIILISTGIFLFKYKSNRNIEIHKATEWQISTDPNFKKMVYDDVHHSSISNTIKNLNRKKEVKSNNGFKIGDIVVVVISDEKYSGKIVKVKKDNRCRVYISALETTLTFKSSDITLKTKEIK